VPLQQVGDRAVPCARASWPGAVLRATRAGLAAARDRRAPACTNVPKPAFGCSAAKRSNAARNVCQADGVRFGRGGGASARAVRPCAGACWCRRRRAAGRGRATTAGGRCASARAEEAEARELAALPSSTASSVGHGMSSGASTASTSWPAGAAEACSARRRRPSSTVAWASRPAVRVRAATAWVAPESTVRPRGRGRPQRSTRAPSARCTRLSNGRPAVSPWCPPSRQIASNEASAAQQRRWWQRRQRGLGQDVAEGEPGVRKAPSHGRPQTRGAAQQCAVAAQTEGGWLRSWPASHDEFSAGEIESRHCVSIVHASLCTGGRNGYTSF
jgi:hypothetical protein